MKEKILVIFTGGTIGSRVKNGVISTDEAASHDLIEGFERDYGGEEEFTCLQPFSFLSENVTPAMLSKLCRVVEENREKAYKGIIITYGSDTLSYATAFLAAAFKDRLKCPLVFVASNKPLSDNSCNGFYNFAGAVWLINYLAKSGFYNDVFAVWHSGSLFAAYKGAELTEADAGSHNHSVFGGEPFAEFYPEGLNNTGEGYTWRVVINDKHEDRCESGLSTDELEAFCENNFSLNDEIIAIRSYPGIDFDSINTDNAKAVLVYGYHSGTFPAKGEKGGFPEFAGKLKAQGIRLYAGSFKKDAVAVYESVKDLGDWVIRLEDVSFEAAYAQVLIREACRTK